MFDCFQPYSFTVHVTKPVAESVQRCQLCKELVTANSIIVATTGHANLGWFISCAHLDCLKGLMSGAYSPILNEAVHITPKVTKLSGPKVEVSVGKHTFTFTPDGAYNVAAGLIMASIASAFDSWAYGTLKQRGLDGISVLVRLRQLRGEKTIIDRSLLGSPKLLLADCWNMFKMACKEQLGLEEEVVSEWYEDFNTHFDMEDKQEPIQ